MATPTVLVDFTNTLIKARGEDRTRRILDKLATKLIEEDEAEDREEAAEEPEKGGVVEVVRGLPDYRGRIGRVKEVRTQGDGQQRKVEVCFYDGRRPVTGVFEVQQVKKLVVSRAGIYQKFFDKLVEAEERWAPFKSAGDGDGGLFDRFIDKMVEDGCEEAQRLAEQHEKERLAGSRAPRRQRGDGALHDRPFHFDASKTYEYSLPENVYGLAMVAYAAGIQDGARDLSAMFLNFVTQSVALLVTNFFCQVVLISYLWLHVRKTINENDKENPPCGSSPVVRATCIGIFVWSLLAEIAETFSMMYWQSLVKHSEETQEILTSDGTLISGLSCMHKALNILTILLPKLVLAICLGFSGVGLLMSASNDGDVILNALAALFILETDELIYQMGCTPWLQKAMKALKELEIKHDGEGGKTWAGINADFMMCCSPCFYGAVIAIAVVLATFFCPESGAPQLVV